MERPEELVVRQERVQRAGQVEGPGTGPSGEVGDFASTPEKLPGQTDSGPQIQSQQAGATCCGEGEALLSPCRKRDLGSE